jgi:hypothetical protein
MVSNILHQLQDNYNLFNYLDYSMYIEYSLTLVKIILNIFIGFLSYDFASLTLIWILYFFVVL